MDSFLIHGYEFVIALDLSNAFYILDTKTGSIVR